MSYHTVVTTESMTRAQAPKKKTEWPDDLKMYVGKAFEEVEDADRPLLEVQLKAMITSAFETNSVWTTNWAEEPLPALSRRKSFKNRWDSLQQGSPPPMSTTDQHLLVPTKRKKSRFDVASSTTIDPPIDTDEQKAKRARRFEKLTLEPQASPVVAPADALGFSEGVPDYDEHTIIGRATKLEKHYLRLTSAPDPETVRPLHVLRGTLELLKQKWKEDANYTYICDQFKSLRQDLTVQRIKNEFTINVYEIHARIALEKSDLGEYNQCQTQLQTLYAQMADTGHPSEFLAYRILYMLHTRNLTEINTVLVNLTGAQRLDPNISHALAVRKAMACQNYPKFFRLYLDAPNMSGYLMDNFVDRERISALAIFCRGYRPTLLLDLHCATILGFGDVEELKDFLIGLGDEVLTSSVTTTTVSESPVLSMDTKKAFDVFEAKKRSTNRVDIKGQI